MIKIPIYLIWNEVIENYIHSIWKPTKNFFCLIWLGMIENFIPLIWNKVTKNCIHPIWEPIENSIHPI